MGRARTQETAFNTSKVRLDGVYECAGWTREQAFNTSKVRLEDRLHPPPNNLC